MLLRKRVLIAFGIGTTTAFALTGLAAVVDELGYESATRILVWPNVLLQSLVRLRARPRPWFEVLRKDGWKQ